MPAAQVRHVSVDRRLVESDAARVAVPGHEVHKRTLISPFGVSLLTESVTIWTMAVNARAVGGECGCVGHECAP